MPNVNEEADGLWQGCGLRAKTEKFTFVLKNSNNQGQGNTPGLRLQ